MMQRLKTFLMLLVIMVAVATPAGIRAEEKNTDFRLEKDYEACTFTVTFDADGVYSGIITDESGNEYTLISTDYSHLFCTVSNAKAGVWTAHISNGVGDIPKIKISVKASSAGIAYDPNQTIRVGLDIADLRVYFEDREVVCDWASSESGDVVVCVTSLDTNVVLGRDTVRKGSHTYRCAVPEGTKTVMVSAVPAESASIVGAERTFTLDVPVAPSAKVTFPSYPSTNQQNCSIKVSLGKQYSFIVECEGKEIANITDAPKGDTDVMIPLELEGANSIVVWVVDAKGNRTSYRYDAVRDTQAPRLEFFSEYDGLTVNTQQLTIEGKVFEFDNLDVNGYPVIPSTDGYFSYDCQLHAGVSEIVVSASDVAGNSTVFQFRINYSSGAAAGTGKKVMAVLVLIAVIAFAVWYFILQPIKKKKAKAAGEDTDETERDEAEKPASFLDKILSRFRKAPAEEYRPIVSRKEKPAKDEKISESDEDVWNAKFIENDFDEDPEAEQEQAVSELAEAVADEMGEAEPVGMVSRETAEEDAGHKEELEPVKEKNKSKSTVTVAEMAVKEPEQPQKKKSVYDFLPFLKKKEDVEYEYVDKKVTVIDDVTIEGYDENYDLSKQKSSTRKAKVEKTIKEKVEKQKKKAPETRRIRYRTSTKNKVKSIIGYCLFILLIWAVLNFVIQLGYVPTESMNPYIKAGDCYIGLRKLVFQNMELKRGDVIAFEHDDAVMQKRIVGLPGDKVKFVDGYVYINGKKLDETEYMEKHVNTVCTREYLVPDNSYFVLGDNRTDSYDSRYWKEPYVKYDDIMALCKVVIPTNSILGNK